MECVELAPAFGDPRSSIAGASSTHSIRFATKHGPKILPRFEQFGYCRAWIPVAVKFSAFLPVSAVDMAQELAYFFYCESWFIF